MQIDQGSMEMGKYKYQNIYETLRQRIKNGGIGEGEYLPTTQELMDEFQTTAVTVARAINILVQEKLVTRTPGVGTVVHAQEKELEPSQIGLIGALLQIQTENRYWERMLEGISDVLRPAGYSLLVGYHNKDKEIALEHINLFHKQGVKVVLFAPFDRSTSSEYESENKDVILTIRRLGMDVLMLDRHIESVPGHFISEHCYAQGKEMVETLITRGFKNPYCISTDYVSVIGDRERAFIDACSESSILDSQDRIVRIPLDLFQKRKYEQVIEYLVELQDADLIICMNSFIFNTMVYLLSSGRLSKINNTKPRLAGFIDIELIDLKDVVAYVEQPVRDLGRYAGRVVKQILKEKTIAYYHVLVPCELRFL